MFNISLAALKQFKLYLIFFTCLLLAVLHLIYSPYRIILYDYDLTLGQIAEKDIIAPFEFYIFKSKETLEAEQETEAAKIKPVYTVSENLKFNAQKNLDFIMQFFASRGDTASVISLSRSLQQHGFGLSEKTISLLKQTSIREQIYNLLTEEYDRIFNIGIYPSRYDAQDIKIVRGNRIIEYSLSRLYSLDEAKQRILEKVTDANMRKTCQEISDIILIENIVIDTEMTKLEKQKARESVPLTLGKVLKNEKIVSKNQKITAIELLKLSSMLRAQKEQNVTKEKYEYFLSALGVFIISLFLILLFDNILKLFVNEEFTSTPRTMIILCCILASAILTILCNHILKVPSLLIPYSFAVLMIALIFNPNTGMIFNFINLVIVTQYLNWSFISPLTLFLATGGSIVALKRMKKKQEFYPLTIYLFLSFLIVHTAISMIRFQSLTPYINQLLYGTIGIVISIIGLILLVPLVERKLNLATKRILLELLDFENPLLKKMSLVAPGTYHHALIVGNLAESAAEAIGANHLLARVGSYYHDIGKTINPKLFIENNPHSSDLHDQMLANESALLIKKHIQDGIELARKHKLPPAVIEIIQQHHGDGQIRYFFNKAMKTELEIEDHDFYYDGPKPRSKEAAIVMIADIVESTTKSMEEFNEESIKKILNDTIMHLINEGQLQDTPITMKELEKIKLYMLPIIMGVYRKRLEYPEK
ncbi:MAG: HDIG domain-containing protein [Candidatus Cloacimonetes bacterium]|nr:HDIG domain-containing protein [Candidatus Cloacimonadota bacterium]